MVAVEKPLAIIPARGGSKRLPRKNIAPLAGKSLLSYAVEAAVESRVFDLVCVSSEDDEILEIAQKLGCDLALKRPPDLAGDRAQVKHVCAHLIRHFSGQGKDYTAFGVLLPTNPFRTASDIRQAYDIFAKGGAYYVMSLVPLTHPPQRAVRVTDDGFVEPFMGIETMKQTQRLEPLYRHDGSVIFAMTSEFMRCGEFYGSKVAPYFIPAERSVDIDTELDLKWAEFLISTGHVVP